MKSKRLPSTGTVFGVE